MENKHWLWFEIVVFLLYVLTSWDDLVYLLMFGGVAILITLFHEAKQ